MGWIWSENDVTKSIFKHMSAIVLNEMLSSPLRNIVQNVKETYWKDGGSCLASQNFIKLSNHVYSRSGVRGGE